MQTLAKAVLIFAIGALSLTLSIIHGQEEMRQAETVVYSHVAEWCEND